ncbi:MAG TPA: helix-turn-helix domain-containing protein [Iamia sp.]|nr:helix-turn-helix domain-containing protein [Iamia sp.]
MSRPLTDADRKAILATYDECQSVNETARRTGRGASTVSRTLRAAGIEPAARARTKAACEAQSIDNAARRARLVSDLLGDAERLRRQLFKPCVVHNFGGRDNTYSEHRIPEPTFADKRAIVASVRMLATTIIDLEQHADRHTDGEYADVDAWLSAMGA